MGTVSMISVCVIPRGEASIVQSRICRVPWVTTRQRVQITVFATQCLDSVCVMPDGLVRTAVREHTNVLDRVPGTELVILNRENVSVNLSGRVSTVSHPPWLVRTLAPDMVFVIMQRVNVSAYPRLVDLIVPIAICPVLLIAAIEDVA